jgi:hypothetical protein
MSPRRGSTPRLTDRLTVGRNVTLTNTPYNLDDYTTSPSCNSCRTKRTIFQLQKVLGTDPKENISQLLLTGRCLATDPREHITPLLGRYHSNVHKKN